MRPLFRHQQQQPLLRLQQPLLLSDDQPSHQPPIIERQQRLVPAQHLRPELHPVLASQRLPAPLPQRLLSLRS
jgi:hypothetical protein